jgi:hypothetical protein
MTGEAIQTIGLIAEHKKHFQSIQAYCMFVGYPRSGHTLVGSLLDAHPNAILALELDALRYVKFGFSRDQIFSLIIANSIRYASAGRTWTGYDYSVPDQWQGRFDQLMVIGDKKGGKSARRLWANPGLLDALASRLKMPLKIIHVARNPMDNIATMVRRGDAPNVDAAITDYFRMADAVTYVHSRTDICSVIDIWSEEFIRHPSEHLRALCAFLGLPAEESYVKSCSSIVFPEPRQSRHNITFTPSQIDSIQTRSASYPHLIRYRYESETPKTT